MIQPILLVGAGGFAREVIDVVDAINAAAPSPAWQIVGYVDDGATERNASLMEARRIPSLGPTDAAAQLPSTPFVIGIGSPAARRRIAAKLEAFGHAAAAPLLHPTATAGYDVTLGDGSVVCAGVRLTTNIRIGRHVHLNLNSTVGHDCVMGDFVSVNPLGSISGDCTIQDDVLIGVGAVILNGIRVGTRATVGGAACVVRDVATGATVKGVPAR
jgi:sugar O-acyltransferase (sialic acid O-acetyltransferase NeuD family)